EVLGAPLLADGELVGMFGIYHDITELQRQKRYYEALIEASPEAIITTTDRGVVTSWNPGANNLFGYTSEEAMGRDLDDLIARPDELQAEAKALTREGQLGHFVRQRTRKDGSIVDVAIVAAPVEVGGEQVARHLIYHDITELQRQKRYYEALLELSPAAIVAIDPDDNVTLWNPGAERMFGYTASEAIGRNVDDLVANHPELREEAEALDRTIEGHEIRKTTRRTRKDGSFVDVELLGAPVLVGGELLGRYAIYVNISDIQRQKRYYESLLETSPTAIITVDMTGTVTSWNPAAERLLGYSRDEALGRDVDELVANRPDLQEEAARITEEASAGKQLHYVTKRTRKDGTLVDVDAVAAPIYVGGQTVGFYAMYSDISELQEQRRFFQALLDISPAAVVVQDFDGTIRSWSLGAEQVFGYTAEEAIGQNIDQLVAARTDLKEEATSFTEAATRGEHLRVVTRRTRKDGSLVDVQLFAAPVVIEERRAGIVVIYNDITEIQRQRLYHESVLSLSPTAIVTVNDEVLVTSWNPAAEQLFGYSAEEALGRHLDDLVTNSEKMRAEGTVMNMRGLRGEIPRSITRRARKDGSLVDVEVTAAPISVSGERAGFVVIYHDITALQEARRDAEAATRAKSAFLATMSHEIRTPLNAVIGMTGLLLDTPLSREQQNFAEVIRSSGDALLSVINEILDFSKIEAGRLDLEAQPFDLSQCVEAVLELVAPLASEKGLDLAYSFDAEVPPSVVGDETRLRQILLNLVNNAVKFTDQGEVVVTVEAEPTPAGNGADGTFELRFLVRDTGIGIPGDRMDRLFESFSQVDASTTRRYGGTGLGLAISKRLVELMNGRMWVDSREGQGSTFQFTIKAKAAPAAPSAQRRATPELQGKRVLIVDDNATNRQILRRQTESWGMLARDTARPAEALQWIQGGDPFDIGVLDMQMPDMDGVTLAREIRLNRGVESLPLVMLSSIGRLGQTTTVDFAATLTKPIKPSQLYDALMDVFGGQPIPDAQDAAPIQAERPVPGTLRILVAEDNAVNQQLAVLLLQKLGYRADLASDGAEALESLERQRYDVVLMDVQMPEMDGLEATRRIHQRWGSRDRPYIIAVTANAMEGDREACLAAGMDDYLSKPIRDDELAAALARSSRGQSAAVLDPVAMERLRDAVGSDAVVELAQTFIADSQRLLSELRDDISAGRAPEARRRAHSLKSTAATFGATELSEQCRHLEHLAQSGTLDGADDLLSRIEEQLHRTHDALKEFSE
ncbi:MAG TPA: PAS domain S-box protein, partial [Actinomycetota bacterium]